MTLSEAMAPIYTNLVYNHVFKKSDIPEIYLQDALAYYKQEYGVDMPEE